MVKWNLRRVASDLKRLNSEGVFKDSNYTVKAYAYACCELLVEDNYFNKSKWEKEKLTRLAFKKLWRYYKKIKKVRGV